MANLDPIDQAELIGIAVELTDKMVDKGGSKESQLNEWIETFKKICNDLVKAIAGDSQPI